MTPRIRRNMERVEMLARPNSRRLRSLWDEKCAILPRDRRDKIKSALEEDYFLSPEYEILCFLTISTLFLRVINNITFYFRDLINDVSFIVQDLTYVSFTYDLIRVCMI